MIVISLIVDKNKRNEILSSPVFWIKFLSSRIYKSYVFIDDLLCLLFERTISSCVDGLLR